MGDHHVTRDPRGNKRYHWLMITSSRISMAPYLAIMYHPAEGTRRCPLPTVRGTGHRGSIRLLLFKRYLETVPNQFSKN